MPRAIEFVEAHDKDLWYRLIEHSLKNEAFLSDLLDHAGVYDVDLARLIAEIPKGMHIPGLRDKVVKIISDYRFQVRNDIIRARSAVSPSAYNVPCNLRDLLLSPAFCQVTGSTGVFCFFLFFCSSFFFGS